jgi:hypothetical protein
MEAARARLLRRDDAQSRDVEAIWAVIQRHAQATLETRQANILHQR